ncbi:hypothetical protein ACSS6W_008824 [Trichoderma asperelloides]|nr:hypothetical protein LI328DRAFT_141900 [Trichoderma asperelloides]
MLVYQGQPKANPDGVESVTAILPTKAEAGAPCIVLWRKATTASTNSKSASREPPNFGNFEAILEKDDNKNIKFKSSTSKLELEFTGDHKTVSLSFQPENGGQIQNIKLTLALGDPFKTHSPQSEASIFGGPVIVQNKGRGNLVALVLCEKDEKGSQKPISVLIEWGSEVAMAEIPLRVQTCQSQDKDTIPDHDENLCFSLNSRQHHFHGMVRRPRRSPPEMLLQIRPQSDIKSDAKPDTKSGTKSNAKSDEKSDEPAAWQTTQSYPSLGKYSNSMHSIVRRSADARHTRVWNDTAENDKGIAPSLVTVTIQESGAKNTSYNKGMAAAGLFVSLLGVAACAAPPSLSSVGWAIGIIGLLLAGQSGHDNFHEDPGKSITKVLYPRDRICRRAVGNDGNEIIVYRAYMEGHLLKITKYFLPTAGVGIHRVTSIINSPPPPQGPAWEVEDMFTFQFAEPQIINLYRYIKIRGLVPTGTNEGGSGLPSHGLPSAGSFVWFDINGKFLKFYEAKKEGSKGQDAITRFGFGLFDPKKDNEAIHHNVMSLVQGTNTQLSTNIAVLNLDDDHGTPVVAMHNWKVSDSDRIAKAERQEDVLDFIKSHRRNWNWGYQWDKKSGEISIIRSPYHYRNDFMTQHEGTHLFLPITNKEWTYTSMVGKDPKPAPTPSRR